MKSVFLITSNLGKVEEISGHLEKFGIKAVGKEMEVPEIQDGHEKVAEEKARYAVGVVKSPLIVEDTALFFEAFDNFPGIHAKFIFTAIGYDGIFRLLEGKPRKAYFKTVIAYCEPGKEPKTFIGMNSGRIAESIRGVSHPRLPYDSVFIPDGEDRVFAEMTKEEKAKYSARAKAAEAFAQWFIKEQ